MLTVAGRWTSLSDTAQAVKAIPAGAPSRADRNRRPRHACEVAPGSRPQHAARLDAAGAGTGAGSCAAAATTAARQFHGDDRPAVEAALTLAVQPLGLLEMAAQQRHHLLRKKLQPLVVAALGIDL